MSASDKERAFKYISKKFKNKEADKLVIRLILTGGEDMLVTELKGAGGLIKCSSMKNSSSNDHDTRKVVLDILVKATVEFFYYWKPVKVDYRKYGEELLKMTLEMQIPRLSKLLLPSFEPFRMGSCTLEGWWSFLIPAEFDKFWKLHGGKVADMVTLSDICHDCPKLNGVYGLSSEILPGKATNWHVRGWDKYQGAMISGKKLASAEEFFASTLED